MREAAKADDCLEKAKPHLEALAVLAHDVMPAFGAVMAEDEVFSGYAGKWIDVATTARDNPGTDCKALQTAIAPMRDACQSCHRDYKS